MMIDETPALIKRYDAILEREHQAGVELEERKQRLTREMIDALSTGGAVKHLNFDGKPVETGGAECLAQADPAVLLALLQELERDPAVPMRYRIRIGGLFATIAGEFGEYAAENAR
jgi:hypothetical protein